MRVYRIVSLHTFNGVGALEFFSEPVKVYADPREFANGVSIDSHPNVVRIEEYVNGHWWTV